MLARTCNRKACELAQFETTLRMALPGACTSCRACHVRCRHDVEPEERSKLNRNKYHVIRCWKAVQKIAGRCLALRSLRTRSPLFRGSPTPPITSYNNAVEFTG